MSKPRDRDKEFSKILLAEMDANMFKDHSPKSQVSTLSIPFYYKLCVEPERDYQPAQRQSSPSTMREEAILQTTAELWTSYRTGKQTEDVC